MPARRQRRVGGEELGVEAQEAVPELVPVAALDGELGLDLLLALGQGHVHVQGLTGGREDSRGNLLEAVARARAVLLP